jgi:hypothetical protein
MKRLLIAAVLASTLSAQAFASTGSTGQIQIGSYTGAGSFADASAYQTAVNTAVSGITATAVSSFDNLAIAMNNSALKTTINFGVSASNAGSWDFRAGVDFGKGGALFVDGIALASKSNDMWWSGSYSNPSQFFKVNTALSAGNHTLTIYGIEGCCSGSQQVQFAAPGATSFRSFGATDGLAAVTAVPEPETYAMLMAGLGLLGAVARRKKSKQA